MLSYSAIFYLPFPKVGIYEQRTQIYNDMKKVLSTLSAALITANAFAIDLSGSRMDYGDNGMTIPMPLLLLGLLIAAIGCFWLGIFKNKDGKRDAPGMIWLGSHGVIGVIFILGNIS